MTEHEAIKIFENAGRIKRAICTHCNNQSFFFWVDMIDYGKLYAQCTKCNNLTKMGFQNEMTEVPPTRR